MTASEQELEELIEWMKPPNAAQSQEYFSEKRTAPGTGEWFLSGEVFNEWKETPNSLLWVQGDGGFHFNIPDVWSLIAL